MNGLLATAGRSLLVAAIVLGVGLLLLFGTADLRFWWLLPFLTGAATGCVLSLRRPGNALGWIFLAFGAIGLLNSGCAAVITSLGDFGGGEPDALAATALWFFWTSWYPIFALATVFPLLLFPEGLQSRRWKPVLWLAVLATSLLTLGAALQPRLADEAAGISMDNPFAPSWLGWLPEDPENSLVSNIGLPILGGCILAAAVGLVLRFRRADGVERQQLRWFALAATVLVLNIALDELLGERYSTSGFANAFLPVALAFLPVACGIAIMRHGLYEIDRILSRTVAYAIVTFVVVATYGVVVTSTTSLLPVSNSLAVAGATLAAAAVFRPVLGWVRDRVDRRFNRAKFNAEQEVDAFSARMRDLDDPGGVEADLLDVSERTLQPTALGLWLKGGSTVIKPLIIAVRMLLVGSILLGVGLLVTFGFADLEPWFAVPFVTGAASGLVLSIRRPGNALGWIFLAYGSIGILNAGCYAAAFAFLEPAPPGQVPPAVVVAAWFSQTTWILFVALATIFPLLLFPEGLQSPRWRWVLWPAIACTAVMTLSSAFVPRLEDESLGLSVDNPFAPSWLGWLPDDPEDNPVANFAFQTLGVCVIVATIGLVLRFRRARGVERQQLRWFAFAATLGALAIVMDSVLGEQYEESDFANAFVPLTMAFIPVACGIAITRHGLYEIDRILSRTLSYALMTGVVLATYAVVVTSVSGLLPGSDALAVAAATLAAAAAFRPVLRRLQDVVDRRFNRARFDAVHEVDAFAGRLRDSVDPNSAADDLRSTVERTLAPGSIAVWTGATP